MYFEAERDEDYLLAVTVPGAGLAEGGVPGRVCFDLELDGCRLGAADDAAHFGLTSVHPDTKLAFSGSVVMMAVRRVKRGQHLLRPLWASPGGDMMVTADGVCTLLALPLARGAATTSSATGAAGEGSATFKPVPNLMLTLSRGNWLALGSLPAVAMSEASPGALNLDLLYRVAGEGGGAERRWSTSSTRLCAGTYGPRGLCVGHRNSGAEALPLTFVAPLALLRDQSERSTGGSAGDDAAASTRSLEVVPGIRCEVSNERWKMRGGSIATLVAVPVRQLIDCDARALDDLYPSLVNDSSASSTERRGNPQRPRADLKDGLENPLERIGGGYGRKEDHALPQQFLGCPWAVPRDWSPETLHPKGVGHRWRMYGVDAFEWDHARAVWRSGDAAAMDASRWREAGLEAPYRGIAFNGTAGMSRPHSYWEEKAGEDFRHPPPEMSVSMDFFLPSDRYKTDDAALGNKFVGTYAVPEVWMSGGGGGAGDASGHVAHRPIGEWLTLAAFGMAGTSSWSLSGDSYSSFTPHFGMWVHRQTRKVLFRCRTMGDDDVGGVSKAEVRLNRWTPLALVRSATHIRLYVGGHLDTEVPLFSPFMAGACDFHVGKDPAHAGVCGAMESVRVWPFALSHRMAMDVALHTGAPTGEVFDPSAYTLVSSKKDSDGHAGAGMGISSLRGERVPLSSPEVASLAEFAARELGRALAGVISPFKLANPGTRRRPQHMLVPGHLNRWERESLRKADEAVIVAARRRANAAAARAAEVGGVAVGATWQTGVGVTTLTGRGSAAAAAAAAAGNVGADASAELAAAVDGISNRVVIHSILDCRVQRSADGERFSLVIEARRPVGSVSGSDRSSSTLETFRLLVHQDMDERCALLGYERIGVVPWHGHRRLATQPVTATLRTAAAAAVVGFALANTNGDNALAHSTGSAAVGWAGDAVAQRAARATLRSILSADQTTTQGVYLDERGLVRDSRERGWAAAGLTRETWRDDLGLEPEDGDLTAKGAVAADEPLLTVTTRMALDVAPPGVAAASDGGGGCVVRCVVQQAGRRWPQLVESSVVSDGRALLARGTPLSPTDPNVLDAAASAVLVMSAADTKEHAALYGGNPYDWFGGATMDAPLRLRLELLAVLVARVETIPRVGTGEEEKHRPPTLSGREEKVELSPSDAHCYHMLLLCRRGPFAEVCFAAYGLFPQHRGGGRLVHRMLLRRRPAAPLPATVRAAAARTAASGTGGDRAVGEVTWQGESMKVSGEGSGPALAAAAAAVDWCCRASGLEPGQMKLGVLLCAHRLNGTWQMVCSVTTSDGTSCSIVDLAWLERQGESDQTPSLESIAAGRLLSQVTLCPGPGVDVAPFDPRGLAVHLDEQREARPPPPPPKPGISMLHVTAVLGHGIAARDNGLSSDPYGTLTMTNPVGDEKEGGTSAPLREINLPMIGHTRHPKWDKLGFAIELRDKASASSQRLRVTLFDRDANGGDDPLGTAEFDAVSALWDRYGLGKWEATLTRPLRLPQPHLTDPVQLSRAEGAVTLRLFHTPRAVPSASEAASEGTIAALHGKDKEHAMKLRIAVFAAREVTRELAQRELRLKHSSRVGTEAPRVKTVPMEDLGPVQILVSDTTIGAQGEVYYNQVITVRTRALPVPATERPDVAKIHARQQRLNLGRCFRSIVVTGGQGVDAQTGATLLGYSLLETGPHLGVLVRSDGDDQGRRPSEAQVEAARRAPKPLAVEWQRASDLVASSDTNDADADGLTVDEVEGVVAKGQRGRLIDPSDRDYDRALVAAVDHANAAQKASSTTGPSADTLEGRNLQPLDAEEARAVSVHKFKRRDGRKDYAVTFVATRRHRHDKAKLTYEAHAVRMRRHPEDRVSTFHLLSHAALGSLLDASTTDDGTAVWTEVKTGTSAVWSAADRAVRRLREVGFIPSGELVMPVMTWDVTSRTAPQGEDFAFSLQKLPRKVMVLLVNGGEAHPGAAAYVVELEDARDILLTDVNAKDALEAPSYLLCSAQLLASYRYDLGEATMEESFHRLVNHQRTRYLSVEVTAAARGQDKKAEAAYNAGAERLYGSTKEDWLAATAVQRIGQKRTQFAWTIPSLRDQRGHVTQASIADTKTQFDTKLDINGVAAWEEADDESIELYLDDELFDDAFYDENPPDDFERGDPLVVEDGDRFRGGEGRASSARRVWSGTTRSSPHGHDPMVQAAAVYGPGGGRPNSSVGRRRLHLAQAFTLGRTPRHGAWVVDASTPSPGSTAFAFAVPTPPAGRPATAAAAQRRAREAAYADDWSPTRPATAAAAQRWAREAAYADDWRPTSDFPPRGASGLGLRSPRPPSARQPEVRRQRPVRPAWVD